MRNTLITMLLTLLLLMGCQAQVDESSSPGKKLMPPKPLTDMILVDDENNPLPLGLLKNQYTYVILAESQCDEFCEQYIELSREAIAQVKFEQPVKQLLVVGYEPDKAWLAKTKQSNPDLTIAVLTRPIWAIFTLPFNQESTEMLGAPLFLVNPMGFIVMIYDDLDDASPLIADINALNKS